MNTITNGETEAMEDYAAPGIFCAVTISEEDYSYLEGASSELNEIIASWDRYRKGAATMGDFLEFMAANYGALHDTD